MRAALHGLRLLQMVERDGRRVFGVAERLVRIASGQAGRNAAGAGVIRTLQAHDTADMVAGRYGSESRMVPKPVHDLAF